MVNVNMMALFVAFEPPETWMTPNSTAKADFESKFGKVVAKFGLQYVLQKARWEALPGDLSDAYQINVTTTRANRSAMTVDQATVLIHSVDVEKAKILSFEFNMFEDLDLNALSSESFAQVGLNEGDGEDRDEECAGAVLDERTN